MSVEQPWGKDEEQTSRALAEACERGEVFKGDLVICAVWPHADDLPSSRWVTHKQLSDRELEAICAKVLEGSCEEVRAPSNPGVSHMSSDELFQCLADVAVGYVEVSRPATRRGGQIHG